VTTPYAERYDARVAAALVEATRSAPFPSLLGFVVVEQAPGTITIALPVRDGLMSGVGALHGGAIAALVDHALSLAVYPLVEPGKWVATLESKVNFLEPVRGGELRATARVLALKPKVAVVRVDVENEGRLVAVGQGTLYVKDR
jgi:uncharacterized protein (TIGR00369 family)